MGERSTTAVAEAPKRAKAEVKPDQANATLTDRFDLNDMLAVFRIRPDGPLFDFIAGQYTTIGLPASAPRCPQADPDDAGRTSPTKWIRRAYSIASASKVSEYVDLYVTLVPSGALTPRLWMLSPGDRLWLGSKAAGHFTMHDLPDDKNVVLVGTGTGLAPYISMIRDHHRCNAGRRFLVVHGARYLSELGYRGELEVLDRSCDTLVYLPTLTRADRHVGWRGHIGRVQSVFDDGTIESALGEPLSPNSTHVFVAGNPEMVEDMEKKLIQKGFTLHTTRSPGALHVERYW